MRPSFFAAVAAAALVALPTATPAEPLKHGHVKPLVAILVDAAGAETTDTLVPYSVLKESAERALPPSPTCRKPPTRKPPTRKLLSPPPSMRTPPSR